MSSKNNLGTLARKAYAGFFWQLLGFSLNTILSVAHIVVMARLLSPEIFGQFAIATIIIVLTAIVSEFGMGPALVQKDSISDEDISFVFLFNTMTGLTLFIVLYLTADNISLLFESALSPLMIQVLAINLLVKPIGLASKALLLRDMEFNQIFVATNLSYFIGMIVVGVIFAILGYGIWSLIIGLVVTSAIASIYFLIVSPISLSFKFNQRDSKYLARYGLGLTTVQGVNQLSLLADKIILSQLAPGALLGLYERSQRIQQMPGVFIGGILDTVMFSTLSKFSTNKLVLGIHFFNFMTITVLIGVYLSVLVFTFGNTIVTVGLGPNWLEAVPILQILAVLVGFQLVARLCDTYIRATGEFKKSVAVKLMYLALAFILAYVGYKFKQITGALIGIVFANAAHATMMVIACQRDAQYPLHKLWLRIRPGITLSIILIVKNIVILHFIAESTILAIVLVLLTDAVFILFMLHSSFLLGCENKAYLMIRKNEVMAIVKGKLRKNKLNS